MKGKKRVSLHKVNFAATWYVGSFNFLLRTPNRPYVATDLGSSPKKMTLTRNTRKADWCLTFYPPRPSLPREVTGATDGASAKVLAIKLWLHF